MVVDIILIAILAISFVVGFVRNPVKCLIDLVLFVAFALVSYNLLVKFQVNILNIFGVTFSDIAKAEIGASISSLNTSLYDLASQLGIDISGINETFTKDELYVELGKSVLHTGFFLVSSIVSMILAYVFGWAIYAIFRKKAKKIKKMPRMILGACSSLILACTMVTFVFSPICMLSNNVLKIDSYVENENLGNAVTFLSETNEKVNEYAPQIKELTTKLNNINEEVNGYEDVIIEFDTSFSNLQSRYKDFGDRLDNLSKKSLSEEDKYAVDEMKTKYKEYEDEINTSSSEFSKTKSEYYDLKEKINNYGTEANNIDEYLSLFDELNGKVSDYYKLVKEANTSYKKFLPTTFSFLGNINFGYINFESTVYDIKDLNGFFDLLDSNLDTFINKDLPKLVDAGNKKIDELINTYEENKKDIESFETQYEEYKETIDKEVDEGREKINDISSKLDEYDEELKKIENKYN